MAAWGWKPPPAARRSLGLFRAKQVRAEHVKQLSSYLFIGPPLLPAMRAPQLHRTRNTLNLPGHREESRMACSPT